MPLYLEDGYDTESHITFRRKKKELLNVSESLCFTDEGVAITGSSKHFLQQGQTLLLTGSQAPQGTPNPMNHSEQFLQHAHNFKKWPTVGMTQPGGPWVEDP
jgi:hypothetical protein